MYNEINFEVALRQRGVIRIGEFTTHAGLSANCKLELDNEFIKSNLGLATRMACIHAEQIGPYMPEIIVPVPNGANSFGGMVAEDLGIRAVMLNRGDHGEYSVGEESRQQIEDAKSISLIDDVFTTGSAFREVAALPEIHGKVIVAGVIWDRSDPDVPKTLDFPLKPLVKKFVPLRIGYASIHA